MTHKILKRETHEKSELIKKDELAKRLKRKVQGE